MNLLDKYIEEVGKHLPSKNRLDLQAEIRSTIEDMLEDRSRQSGRPVDEALVSEVLQAYGAPQKVAAAYRPSRYLIGPRLYHTFEMVLKIVLTVLTVLAVIGFGVNWIVGDFGDLTFFPALGQYLLQYLAGVVSAFGYIALIFAILERVLPASEFEQEAEKWTPEQLSAVPDPNAARRGELIFETLFILLGLTLLNLYPNLMGLAMIKGRTWMYIPTLSEAFFGYLPWINLLGGLEILLNLYLLRRGFWHVLTRLSKLAIEVAGIVLAGVMLFGPSLISVAALSQVLGEASEQIARLLNIVPQIVLLILIVTQSVEAIQIVLRLLNQRTAGKFVLPPY